MQGMLQNGAIRPISRATAYTVQITSEIYHERRGLDLPLLFGRTLA